MIVTVNHLTVMKSEMYFVKRKLCLLNEKKNTLKQIEHFFNHINQDIREFGS